MHNISKVFMFELKSILSKKSLIITTAIISVILIIVTTIPTIISLFDNGDNTPVPTDKISMMGSGIVILNNAVSIEELNLFFVDVEIFDSESDVRKALTNEKINQAFIITSPTSLNTIVINRELYSNASYPLQNALRQLQIRRNLVEMNLDPNQVNLAYNVNISINEEVIGKDASDSFLIAYVLMFAVYMLVIMYGAMVSTSVAREKDNRTMELLITSTKPDALIIGKVFANGLAGVLQFGFISIVAILGIFVNRANYPSEILSMVLGGLRWDSMMVFLIFTFFGYLLYLFIYASLGSLVSKMEDVSSSVAPITLLFIASYVIATLGLQMPEIMIVKIGSYIPFTAILAMPVRYFLTSVSWIELVISLMLMTFTAWLFARISIDIYRLGSLNYGNKLSFVKALQLIREDKRK
ncbi:MAG: ABC transporter permease [Firmicutes bacterium HGW-Firmicutes-20]|nr:MAG: ABC transporter permease [Firmicutes bacterium HGW-Firmicutes-20]PKM89595.1 MAG: ABC transporter permease [Firmicutes bacterium HGW-Firmicutes-10]